MFEMVGERLEREQEAEARDVISRMSSRAIWLCKNELAFSPHRKPVSPRT